MKTVKVRIAVAVSDEDSWFAYGCSNSPDDEAKNEAVGNVPEGPSTFVWVEADVPVPEDTTIQGTALAAPPRDGGVGGG